MLHRLELENEQIESRREQARSETYALREQVVIAGAHADAAARLHRALQEQEHAQKQLQCDLQSAHAELQAQQRRSTLLKQTVEQAQTHAARQEAAERQVRADLSTCQQRLTDIETSQGALVAQHHELVGRVAGWQWRWREELLAQEALAKILRQQDEQLLAASEREVQTLETLYELAQTIRDGDGTCYPSSEFQYRMEIIDCLREKTRVLETQQLHFGASLWVDHERLAQSLREPLHDREYFASMQQRMADRVQRIEQLTTQLHDREMLITALQNGFLSREHRSSLRPSQPSD